MRLANALDGLPLAAEQGAVFLKDRKGISFDDYATDIATLIKRPKPKGTIGDYPDTVYAAFVKSLDTLKSVDASETALDLLRLCAFLSPDGVELGLLSSKEGGAVLPASFIEAISDKYAREDARRLWCRCRCFGRRMVPPGRFSYFIACFWTSYATGWAATRAICGAAPQCA